MTNSMGVDWTQIVENDRMRVSGGISYPETVYVPYYTMADGSPLVGDVVIQPEPPGGWAQVVADNRVIAGQAKSYAAALKAENDGLRKLLARMRMAGMEGENASEDKGEGVKDVVQGAVDDVFDYLIGGKTDVVQRGKLKRGIEQADRGAVGPMRGIG